MSFDRVTLSKIYKKLINRLFPGFQRNLFLFKKQPEVTNYQEENFSFLSHFFYHNVWVWLLPGKDPLSLSSAELERIVRDNHPLMLK